MPRMCKFYTECKNYAAYRIPHSGLALCKEHFLKNVEKRVAETIEKKKMFSPRHNDKLLLALSGGKDSTVLLTILRKLYPDYNGIEALYVELGIGEGCYSSDSGKISAQICEQLNVPFHVVNINEKYDLTIDEVHQLRESFTRVNLSLGKGHFKGECSYCGMFKRYSINRFAAENKFTVVATGHNLTDETTSLLNNFFNMDLYFLSRPGPKSDSDVENLVPRVKPLFFISEEEIMMYAYYAQVIHLPTECPYSLLAPNLKLKSIVQEIESYRQGNMIALMRKYHKVMLPVIKATIKPNDVVNRQCKVCGMPTFSDKCSFCRTLNNLRQRKRQLEKTLLERKEEGPK